jgi:hypothetical protein
MKRLADSGEYEFGIYEVYYDDNGKVNGWTEESMTPTCPSEEGLLHEIEIMKEAFKKETLLYM